MTRYGAPERVLFCRRCVMSNQRPSSTVERQNVGQPKTTLSFNADGICAACEYQEHIDHRIDWAARDAELRALCDQYRSADGRADCIVPGSGGKDSWFAASTLRERYGMHPLTVTWAPMMWTDVGLRNYQRWAKQGDHMLAERDDHTHRMLTRIAFLRLPYPFQPFVVGQRQCAAKLSRQTGIKLVFYGENPAQYAGPVQQNYEPRMEPDFYSDGDPDILGLRIGGVSGRDLVQSYGLKPKHLEPYLPVSRDDVQRVGTDFRYLGYYLKWDPQEVYYYAQERGFEPAECRTEGTFSRYSSIDDKLDTLHYYTTLCMFGIGRCTYDASQEVRWGKLTREQAVKLVHRYDTEYPARYEGEWARYMGLSTGEIRQRLDAARAEHLWRQTDEGWQLMEQVR